MPARVRIASLRKLAIPVSCLFVFGGAVSYGPLDFWPALPFLAYLLVTSAKKKGSYLAVSLGILMISVPLYFAKKEHGALFHPALGRTFVLKKDACFLLFPRGTLVVTTRATEPFVLAREVTREFPCVSSGAERAEVYPRGTKYKVRRVSVSHEQTVERYALHASTPLGDMPLTSFGLFSWEEGKEMAQSDLRNPWFYYPSLLLYWPLSPILVISKFLPMGC